MSKREMHWLWVWWDRGRWWRESTLFGFLVGSGTGVNFSDALGIVLALVFLSPSLLWVRKWLGHYDV